MSQLRRILAKYEARFTERGFSKMARESIFERKSKRHYVCFDRMKGGDLRLFLSVDRVVHDLTPSGIEAESPWWEIVPPEDLEFVETQNLERAQKHTLEYAVECAWQFLEEVGFTWLEDPLAKTPTQWRVEHQLLMRDYRQTRVAITWPKSLSLNERVMSLKRGVEIFRSKPALEVRAILERTSILHLEDMGLADALELKQNAGREGLIVELKRL